MMFSFKIQKSQKTDYTAKISAIWRKDSGRFSGWQELDENYMALHETNQGAQALYFFSRHATVKRASEWFFQNAPPHLISAKPQNSFHLALHDPEKISFPRNPGCTDKKAILLSGRKGYSALRSYGTRMKDHTSLMQSESKMICM